MGTIQIHENLLDITNIEFVNQFILCPVLSPKANHVVINNVAISALIVNGRHIEMLS